MEKDTPIYSIGHDWRSSGMTQGKTDPLSATDYKDPPKINQSMKVRRLTPTECERLQGWPDGYTDVPYKGKPPADGVRYKALGNGMAQPCARWIIKRIVEVTENE